MQFQQHLPSFNCPPMFPVNQTHLLALSAPERLPPFRPLPSRFPLHLLALQLGLERVCFLPLFLIALPEGFWTICSSSFCLNLSFFKLSCRFCSCISPYLSLPSFSGSLEKGEVGGGAVGGPSRSDSCIGAGTSKSGRWQTVQSHLHSGGLRPNKWVSEVDFFSFWEVWGKNQHNGLVICWCFWGVNYSFVLLKRFYHALFHTNVTTTVKDKKAP